jgi:hypothetical protein
VSALFGEWVGDLHAGYSFLKAAHSNMKFGQGFPAADLGSILHFDPQAMLSFRYFATRSTLTTVPSQKFSAAPARVLADVDGPRPNGPRDYPESHRL